MKSDEIDKIIAEALEQEKSNKRSHKHPKSDKVKTARKVLNALFMIGFVAAIIIYFVMPDEVPEKKIIFFSVGFGSVFLKLVEFYLRFMF